jgi:hypothetical protein
MHKEAFTRAPAGRANSSIRVRFNVERPQVVLRHIVRDAQLLVECAPTCALLFAALCVDNMLPLRVCREGPGVLVAVVAGLLSFLVRVARGESSTTIAAGRPPRPRLNVVFSGDAAAVRGDAPSVG